MRCCCVVVSFAPVLFVSLSVSRPTAPACCAGSAPGPTGPEDRNNKRILTCRPRTARGPPADGNARRAVRVRKRPPATMISSCLISQAIPKMMLFGSYTKHAHHIGPKHRTTVRVVYFATTNHDKTKCTTNGLCTPDTVGSGQANLRCNKSLLQRIVFALLKCLLKRSSSVHTFSSENRITQTKS